MATYEHAVDKGDDFQEKLLGVNRTTKVRKGGRSFSFTACVVVGDGKGRIGYGTGSSVEVPVAIDKAKKNNIGRFKW